jgi:hypothetical protein
MFSTFVIVVNVVSVVVSAEEGSSLIVDSGSVRRSEEHPTDTVDMDSVGRATEDTRTIIPSTVITGVDIQDLLEVTATVVRLDTTMDIIRISVGSVGTRSHIRTHILTRIPVVSQDTAVLCIIEPLLDPMSNFVECTNFFVFFFSIHLMCRRRKRKKIKRNPDLKYNWTYSHLPNIFFFISFFLLSPFFYRCYSFEKLSQIMSRNKHLQ